MIVFVGFLSCKPTAQQPRLVGYQLPLTPIVMDVYNAHCYVYQCEHYYCTLYIYNYLYTHNTYTEYHEIIITYHY